MKKLLDKNGIECRIGDAVIFKGENCKPIAGIIIPYTPKENELGNVGEYDGKPLANYDCWKVRQMGRSTVVIANDKPNKGIEIVGWQSEYHEHEYCILHEKFHEFICGLCELPSGITIVTESNGNPHDTMDETGIILASRMEFLDKWAITMFGFWALYDAGIEKKMYRVYAGNPDTGDYKCFEHAMTPYEIREYGSYVHATIKTYSVMRVYTEEEFDTAESDFIKHLASNCTART